VIFVKKIKNRSIFIIQIENQELFLIYKIKIENKCVTFFVLGFNFFKLITLKKNIFLQWEKLEIVDWPNLQSLSKNSIEDIDRGKQNILGRL